MRLLLVLLALTFVFLLGLGTLAHGEESIYPSSDEILGEVIEELELGRGLVIEEGVAEDGQPCLLVINQNTREVLWEIVYEDKNGDGSFSSEDEIVSLVNPAGKEIPVSHLVSPLRNRLRKMIQERIQAQEENQDQEETQNQERAQNQERVRERVQERIQNEEDEEGPKIQEKTQERERVQKEEKLKDRPRPKEKLSRSR